MIAGADKKTIHILIAIVLCLLFESTYAADTTNTITRDYFNFGHQLGYMYSRMEEVYFDKPGTWYFETGFLSYYTSQMPLVRNDYWKKRLMLLSPLHLIFYPTNFMMVRFAVTDAFIEFPYVNYHSLGGKSPRFEVKFRLLQEMKYTPAVAFTVGVKFSSAKPFTIWANNHNYDESNGLAGAGTGVADYLLLFTATKKLGLKNTLSIRFGLAPLGSPVEYVRGSAQADEIPYGISYKREFSHSWSSLLEVSGMYNGLSSTKLAHYSVVRLQFKRQQEKGAFTLNLEHGLTRESDEWVVGFYKDFKWNSRK